MTRILYLSLTLACLCGGATAAARGPVVSIIIDDIGHRAAQDRLALSLSGPLAFAILPHSPGAAQMAQAAKRKGFELILHLPMQSESAAQKTELGTLTQAMSHEHFVRNVRHNLATAPAGIIAVNNHQGSLLTADYQRMSWLMRELSRHAGVAFIDSRTTHRSVALQAARQFGIPAIRRDIFLDHEPHNIARQFAEWIKLARQQGTALAIAHPHAATINFLKDNLSLLKPQGIELAPVSELLAIRQAAFNATGDHHDESISAHSSGL